MNTESISQEAINAWRDYVLKQVVENLEINKEKIIEFINDKIYDYVIDNEYEIFAELEDMEVLTNEDYLKD